MIMISSIKTSTGDDDSLFQGTYIAKRPIEENNNSMGSSSLIIIKLYPSIISFFNLTFSITTLPLQTPTCKLFLSNPVRYFPK